MDLHRICAEANPAFYVMSAKRVFFLQHGLWKTSGHWYGETLAWRKAVQEAGLGWQCGVHRTLPEEAAKECDAQRPFAFRPYDMVEAPESMQEFTTFIELADMFAAPLLRTYKDISADDLVIVPFTTPAELMGLARWLERVPPDRRPQVAAVFHHLPLTWKIDLDKRAIRADLSLWEYSARALRLRVPDSRFRFFAVLPQLASFLAQAFKGPVALLPVVFQPPPILQLPKRYDISCQGGGRPEQGAHLWGGILAELAKLRPGLTASVQMQTEEEAQMLRIRTGLPEQQLDIAVGHISDEDYFTRMAASRLLLLTYHTQAYALRESSVFLEGGCLGVPSLVPAGTALAYQVRSGVSAGAWFLHWKAKHIAERAQAALEDKTIAAKAQALAPGLRKKHDARTALRTVQRSFAV